MRMRVLLDDGVMEFLSGHGDVRNTHGDTQLPQYIQYEQKKTRHQAQSVRLQVGLLSAKLGKSI